MSTNELSERFISAFCRLEDELRKLTGSSSHESFTYMLDHVCHTSKAFAHFRDDLREFAELRNAIVHKRLGDKPIAEPHPDVVVQIESIADMVTSAPALGDHFRKHVTVCSPNDNIRSILSQFLKGRFNQVPVYSGKRLVGLLTAESIALWLAQSFEESDYVDPQTRVQHVLGFASGKDDYAVLGGHQSIFDAIEAFDSAYDHGRRLKALIITQSGNSNEQPIGIITTMEVPLLIRLINPEPLSPLRRRR